MKLHDIIIDRSKIGAYEVNSVNARDLWRYLESKQDFSNWIKNRIGQYGFVEGEDYITFTKIIEREIGATKTIDYILTIDTAKELAMVAKNKKGREVRKYFIEVEKKSKNQAPQTLKEALLLAVAAEEEKERLALERDKAIAQRLHIRSKAEATAMATASNEKQRANKLQIELDKSKQYCTIKRMLMLHRGQNFDWRVLKKTSAEMNLNPIDIFDQNYGTVKSYHRDVWVRAYGLEC